MSEMMVRKQIYLPRRQNQILKRLAQQRGISEAEVIRQALEREAKISEATKSEREQALDRIFDYVHSLRERPEFMQREPYKWNRQELYEERESRWVREKPEE